jgi:hypothetical protein
MKMSLLQTAISRDVTLEVSPAGRWQYIVSEGEISFYTSHSFTTHDACLSDALSFLDAMHEEKPLLSNSTKMGEAE